MHMLEVIVRLDEGL